MNDYDVGKIYKEIEIELIKSMNRTLGYHKKWEKEEGFEWEQWQAKKIQEMRKYSNSNRKIMANYTKDMRKSVTQNLFNQYLEGGKNTDIEVIEAIKKGFKIGKSSPSDDFFKGNNKKIDSLIKVIDSDMSKAENAALRMMDDVYRKTVFKAEAFLGSGASTMQQAVDMATKDFLSKGLTCIKYADGKNVNIASYSRMAVRTSNKRVYLMGEGERRKDWGLSTVIVSQYSACSDTCLPWQGRVYIDDVYSGGSLEDSEYPLLSQAISGGLFHPNCKHTLSTFFEEINEKPKLMRESEVGDNYEKIKREAEINRNIQKYERLSKGSLDPDNKRKYKEKLNHWNKELKTHKKQIPNNLNIDATPKGQNSLPNDIDKVTSLLINDNSAFPILKTFEDSHKKWDKNNIKEFAKNIVDDSGLNIPVSRRTIKENGFCSIEFNLGGKFKIKEYVLNSKDIRGQKYQIKTAFHELFHAKVDGLPHAIKNKADFSKWTYYDDVFAECTAHYLSKNVGIIEEITPSYPKYLVETLPKLKKLPEFKHCKTIADFGEVALKYRFGKNPVSDWNPLINRINTKKYDIIDYSKNYLKYIENNKENLVDQMLENLPQYVNYKSNMLGDLDNIVDKINNGKTFTSNEDVVFNNVLILAMNREGVM